MISALWATTACPVNAEKHDATSPMDAKKEKKFEYNNERFADLQMLRYKVEGFENLTLKQKTFIYYLQEAALYGRDILFDQNGKYNLRIRKMLEDLYVNYPGDKESKNFKAMEEYLKRVWFSNGIHHHYGSEKFVPGFSRRWLQDAVHCPDEIADVIFNPNILQKRVNLAEGADLVKTSASNYYENVTQAEAEDFYNKQKAEGDSLHPVMYGMNSRLVKTQNGDLIEKKWTINGLYGDAIKKIVENLKLARPFAEDAQQQKVIDLLISYYETGDLKTFDQYSIAWVENTAPLVDFVNGFIECYGDPLGLKCSWESIVIFKDVEATKRTETLSANAQWFEDHSPVAPEFKKEKVKGITAKVIKAAILAGDLYPSTAIGINLPNADWIRAQYGSKSITISNITDAYNKASHGNGFREEFVIDEETLRLIDKYGDVCDDLHTDLHECLGHGSGQLLPGVDPDALKAYGNTIEEARADLFGLYYIADPKLVELGLVPDGEAYKSQYYTYMMNGLMTQLVRINPGNIIEEAHMRNRALIAHWCLEQGHAVRLVKRNGKTYVEIVDYAELRTLIARLLAEVQRIKSEGDFETARQLVERYAVNVDPTLHAEVLERYQHLNLAPYKGFINPMMLPVLDENGEICDIQLNYSESYAHQMLRYSTEYATLI